MEKTSCSTGLWTANYTELTPSDYPDHPKGLQFNQWMRYINSVDVWVPMMSKDSLDKRYFYCTKCGKWLVYYSTKSNITRHLGTHSKEKSISIMENNPEDIEKGTKVILDSNTVSQILSKFILSNGLPFRLIEDCNLLKLSNSLRTRKSLSSYCKATSMKIVELIKKELLMFDNISIAIDEWKDKSKRSYLGVTAQAVSEERMNFFTLALKPLIGETLDGQLISENLDQILNQYEICDKVRGCVSDSGSNMISAIRHFTFPRIPCSCHLFNNLMKEFISAHKKRFDAIIKLQIECSTSRFVRFCSEKQTELRIIPSYCPVRWYSMCKLINGLFKMKQHIIDFRLRNKIIMVEPSIWDDIEVLFPVFEDAELIISTLESDDFGSVSYILRGFTLFSQHIQLLPERYLQGKISVHNKFREMWEKYRDLWDPFLFAATRLNPSIDIHETLEADQIIRGDEYIISLMKKFDKNPKLDNPIKKSNALCSYGNNLPNSIESIFEKYKSVEFDSKSDLYDYWKGQLKTKNYILARAAIQILSVLSTSASVEREFSASRRAIGFQRLRMNPDKVENMIMIIGNPEIADRIMK